MRPDIVPGAVFPDYELSDHRGDHPRLSELQHADPMVLVLSRGGFCPKELSEHGMSASLSESDRSASLSGERTPLPGER